MEKFVVAATQRSGTAFFGSVLNKHPEIYLFSELFLDYAYKDDPNNFYNFWLKKIMEDNINITYRYRINNIRNFLLHEYNSVENMTAIGIDIKYTELQRIPEIIFLMEELNIKVIHIVRKNILKTYISNYLNNMKQQLKRSAHGKKKVPAVKVYIKPDNALIHELERRRNEINYFSNVFSKNLLCLEINYEDLFENSQSQSETIVSQVLDQIYDFLCVQERRHDLITNLKKTNPNKLTELIENYDEVADFLSGTEWAYLLEEDSIKDIIKMGEELYKKNEYDKALNEFVKVIERDPNNFIAYNGIGVINWELGNMEKSIEGFTKALELNPLDQSTILNIVDVLKAIRRVDDAKDICSSYLKTRPDDVDVKEAYATL